MVGLGQIPTALTLAPAGGGNEFTFKIICKADEGYCLSVRDGNAVLVRINPLDQYQHWFKDTSFGTNIKDQAGKIPPLLSSTRPAVSPSCTPKARVELMPYSPDYLEVSAMWTESGEVGQGFRCIRMVNNTRLNFDALNGDEYNGGVHDGTTIVLSEWIKGDSQRWKFISWGDDAYLSSEPTFRIYCKASEDLSATVENGQVILVVTNPHDELQHWFKDTGKDGYPATAFALVNKVTGEAIKHSEGEGHPVMLVPYNCNTYSELLWTESRGAGGGFGSGGFRRICMVNNTCLNFEALHGDKDHGGVRDGTSVVLCKRNLSSCCWSVAELQLGMSGCPCSRW
ncbi:hypothetical protein ACQ4PT_022684 [Festuca glaucescens]